MRVKIKARAMARARVRVRLTCVPDLRLDDLGIVLDAACRKLHTDGRLGVEVKLVASEPAQQVGLAHARIANDYDCGEGRWSWVRGPAAAHSP